MSSPPPPPPPPSGNAPPPPRVGPPPAWNRRMLRDQRRAAQLAARQQRLIQRMQLRAHQPTSVLGPVLLVTLGLLFIGLEIGHVQAGVAVFWLARWWPLLLLGAGLVLLAEWAVDMRGAPASAAVIRRRLGPAGVLLLVLIALGGIAATGIHNGSHWLQQNMRGDLGDSWGLDQVFAQHSDTEQELEGALAPGALLTVQNYRGDVHVTGASPDGQVHIAVHQRLQAWRRDELQVQQQRDQPQLKKNGSGLLLVVPGADRDRADLTIELPHASALEIAPEQGEITVNELRGPVSIGQHQGNIDLTGLTGPVHLAIRDDDATVTGHSLNGDLNLEGRSGDVALSDVTGSVTLHGDFFGTTHLERISGPVHFQSSFTDLACAGVAGDLSVEGRSDLAANDLQGPITLSTTDRNISLSAIHKGLTLNDRNGTVSVAMADPLGPVQIGNANGSVTLSLPKATAFAVQAETQNGQIRNDFGFSPEQQSNRSTLHGQVRKGGVPVSVKTSEGDITISGLTPGERGTARTSDEDDSGKDDDQ